MNECSPSPLVSPPPPSQPTPPSGVPRSNFGPSSLLLLPGPAVSSADAIVPPVPCSALPDPPPLPDSPSLPPVPALVRLLFVMPLLLASPPRLSDDDEPHASE